jgi:hypothetical protein
MEANKVIVYNQQVNNGSQQANSNCSQQANSDCSQQANKYCSQQGNKLMVHNKQIFITYP